MKQKAIPPITLTAGQSARLTFNITVPDGTAIPTLIGALTVRNKRVDMTTDGSSALIIPPLQPGVHLAEVRAGGTCILYGHIEVLPSPLSNTTGIQDYTVDIDMTADVLTVNLTLAGGPAGEPGASAYQIWLNAGNSGTEEEFLASLIGPQGDSGLSNDQVQTMIDAAISDFEISDHHTAQGMDNYNAGQFMLDSIHIPQGQLKRISIPCRTNSLSAFTTTPVYLLVYEQTADGSDWVKLAASTNTVTQTVNTTGSWQFDSIPLSGRSLKFCIAFSQNAAWSTELTMGLRVSSRPTGDTSTVGPNTAYLVDVTLTVSASVARFTPISHVSDSVAHLTTGEHTALTELIESGGGTITIDSTPTSGSSNAVSSGGVFNVLFSDNEIKINNPSSTLGPFSVMVGNNASSSSGGCVSIGDQSRSTAFATACGYSSTSETMSIAYGASAKAAAKSSGAIGTGAYCADEGVIAIKSTSATWDEYGSQFMSGYFTQLYLISNGCSMSETYADGRAALGYVVVDSLSASIIERGVIPLAQICTQHTSDFTPTGVDNIRPY